MSSDYETAVRLADILWQKHWKEDAPHWVPMPTLSGVLSQIDNMTAGLVRPNASGPSEQPGATAGQGVTAALAGARVEESPGEPTHILCIGWNSIRELSEKGMIWSDEHQAGIIAADDLFNFDFTEHRYGRSRIPL